MVDETVEVLQRHQVQQAVFQDDDLAAAGLEDGDDAIDLVKIVTQLIIASLADTTEGFQLAAKASPQPRRSSAGPTIAAHDSSGT